MEASASAPPAVEPVVAGRRRPAVSPRLLRLAGDERLVALVRAGSEPAFEALYDRHHRGLLSFCRHMLGTRSDAEDALQHTFMAAYRSLLDSTDEVRFGPWAYTIARNRCLSIIRARREQPVGEVHEAVTAGLAEQVQQRQDLVDVLHDISGLPEDQRAALVLSELGDLSHDDIAGVLGCERDRVKALVFQARTHLQSSREARDTSCVEVQELLASLSGGSLRRNKVRRHVRGCTPCQAFESEVKRQRKAMAVLLPVVPTLGLKDTAMAAAFGKAGGAAGVAAAGAAGAGASATGGLGALTAKVLVVAAVAGGGAMGVKEGAQSGLIDSSNGTSAPKQPGTAPGAPAGAPDAATESAGERSGKAPRRRGHTDRGKNFAKTRGKGLKRGLNGTQPSQRKAGKTTKPKKAKPVKKVSSRVTPRATATPRPVRTTRPTPTPRAKGQAAPAPTAEPLTQPTPESGAGKKNRS